MAHMVDPPLHTGIELGESDFPRTIGFVACAEPAGGVAHLAGLDLAVFGKTTNPSQGIPLEVGVTCVRLSCTVRRSSASRDRSATFQPA